MSDSNVVMKVPEETLQKLVSVHAAELISKQEPALLRKMVESALSQKRNSYDKRTVFEEMVNKYIRDAASNAAKAYLQSLQPEIEKEVRKQLGVVLPNRRKAAKDIADQLVNAICSNIRVSVHLSDS